MTKALKLQRLMIQRYESNSVSMVGPIQVTTMPSPPLVLELPIIPQSVQSTRPVTCGLQQQLKERELKSWNEGDSDGSQGEDRGKKKTKVV